MRKKFFILFPLFFLSLTSCDLLDKNDNTEKEDDTKTEEDTKTDTSKEKASEITIFSINDLHGSLTENTSAKELGIAKLDYAIKHDEDYNKDTSIIISCGDSWEGGYIAHEEKDITDSLLGKLGVEAMVLGNHDFSWGLDKIKELKAKSPYPYLACNIRNPYGAPTNEFSDNYKIITKKGVKVGIIGLTGDQGSILSSNLSNYTFNESTTDLTFVKDQIDALNKEKCDLITVAIHGSPILGDGDNSSKNQPLAICNTFNTNEIQGMFASHTHKFEKAKCGSNNIPVVQGGCNSKGYAKMTFDVEQKKAISYSFVEAYDTYNNIKDTALNQEILSQINTAEDRYCKENICTFNGKFYKNNHLKRFIPYVMIEEVKRLGWTSKNNFIAIHNYAGIRSDIPSGKVKKDTMFKAEPFDNKVMMIQNVPGKDLASYLGTIKTNNEAGSGSDSSYTCRYAYAREGNLAFDSSLKYDVVTIDYVSESSYWLKKFSKTNYPQYNIVKNGSDNTKNTTKYILDVLVDYVVSQKSGSTLKTFNANDFISTTSY